MSSSDANEKRTLVIDGRELEIPEGRTVIQIAHDAGIDVPHYCYHPGLSIAGNCRICMVEVEGNPKPQIACKLEPQPGMVVHTESDLAKEARAGTMEFLLVNHPLDCPICDQAGECHLQEYSYQLGEGRARTTTDKTHLPKNVPFGSKIVYDAERCIKCTLCVRFMDEVAGTSELSMGHRSDQEIVIMTSKGEFSTPYAMNIIDICPVGALTSRDFRFQSRLWFMDFAPSLCTGCARGCNVTMGGRQGRFLRMEPRYNADVNEWWMCDPGRLDYKFVNAATRLVEPRVRDADGTWREAGWEEAISAAGAALRDVEGGHVLLDGNATLEEMLVARRIAEQLGGAVRFTARVGDDGDETLLVDEKGANARGAETLGLERVGHEDEDAAGAAVLFVEREANVPAALRDASGALVVFALDEGQVPDSAQVAFPLGSWAERDGLMMNVDGIVQTLKALPAVGPPGMLQALEVLEELLLELDPTYAPGGRAGAVEALGGLEAFADVELPAVREREIGIGGLR